MRHTHSHAAGTLKLVSCVGSNSLIPPNRLAKQSMKLRREKLPSCCIVRNLKNRATKNMSANAAAKRPATSLKP